MAWSLMALWGSKQEQLLSQYNKRLHLNYKNNVHGRGKAGIDIPFLADPLPVFRHDRI